MSEKRITAEMLAQKDAHCAQLDKFRERFPDGLDVETVTPEEVVGLDVGWMVHALLPAAAQKAYAEAESSAWEAFEEATAPVPAWDAYVEAEAPARKAYREATARAAIEVFREHWQEEESHDE